MNSSELLEFARANIEATVDQWGASAYRCSATLTDGLVLPCVLLRSKVQQVRAIERRLREEQPSLLAKALGAKSRSDYSINVLEVFGAAGNRITDFNIAEVSRSRYAIPVERLAEIGGEHAMGWTQFTAVMRDGREFSFGTSFLTEFFNMPEGYSAADVAAIHSGKQVPGTVYRERPFFDCFLEGL